MRSMFILTLLAAAGCSSAEPEKKAEKAASLEPGQWETTREIVAFKAADTAPTPAIRGKVGDKATGSICIGKDEVAKPPAPVFVGQYYQCSY